MLGVMRYIPKLDFLPFKEVIIDTDWRNKNGTDDEFWREG